MSYLWVESLKGMTGFEQASLNVPNIAPGSWGVNSGGKEVRAGIYPWIV